MYSAVSKQLVCVIGNVMSQVSVKVLRQIRWLTQQCRALGVSFLDVMCDYGMLYVIQMQSGLVRELVVYWQMGVVCRMLGFRGIPSHSFLFVTRGNLSGVTFIWGRERFFFSVFSFTVCY